MADDHPRLRLCFEAIQAVGALAVAATLWFTIYSINEQARWNRERFTFDLLARYTGELKEHSKIVEGAYPDLRDSSKGSSLSLGEAQILVRAKEEDLMPDGKMSRADVRRHLNAIFNYYEDVAAAWEKEICERDEVEEETAPAIVRWTIFFENYIKAEDRMGGEQTWPPLMRVVKIWKSKGHGLVLLAANPSPTSTPRLSYWNHK